MIVDPWDLHPMNALCASLDSIRATRWVCGGFSSSWTKYNSISPESYLSCPSWVQCVLLIPRTSLLYLLISECIWLVFPVSHIVWIFDVSVLNVVVAVRCGMGFVTCEVSRLPQWGMIIILNEDCWTRVSEFIWFRLFILVGIYLAMLFTPHPTVILYSVLGPTLTLEKLQAELTKFIIIQY